MDFDARLKLVTGDGPLSTRAQMERLEQLIVLIPAKEKEVEDENRNRRYLEKEASERQKVLRIGIKGANETERDAKWVELYTEDAEWKGKMEQYRVSEDAWALASMEATQLSRDARYCEMFIRDREATKNFLAGATPVIDGERK